MPMQFKVKEGFLHVLPGDDLYQNPNYHEADHDIDQYAEKTMDEMRAVAKNLFRSEQHDLYDVKIVSNISPYDGHIKVESDPIAKM